MDDLEQLVTQAGSGPVAQRHRAFGLLVRRFQDMAYAWAYARLGNAALCATA